LGLAWFSHTGAGMGRRAGERSAPGAEKKRRGVRAAGGVWQGLVIHGLSWGRVCGLYRSCNNATASR
jgi:hypothetical protein